MVYSEEKTIIENNRHQFIHMNYTEQKNVLQGLMYEFPVSVNEDKPIMVYSDSFGLPNCDKHQNCDRVVLAAMAREYLNFSIAYNVIRVLQRQLNLKLSDEDINEFLSKMNLSISKDFGEVKSLGDLLLMFNNIRYQYYKEYLSYSRTGEFNITDRNMPMMFLDIEEFIKNVKEMLHNNAHIAMVLDVKGNMCSYSYSAVNTLVYSRCNSDLVIKIVCGEKDWKNYFTLNGEFIERVHDYDVEYIKNDEKDDVKKLIFSNK